VSAEPDWNTDGGTQPVSSDPQWTTDGPNILATEVQERIRQALSRGWIAGIHQYFGGGGSGDALAFRTYDSFLSRVTNARPGDLFTLWSVADLIRKGLVLVDQRYLDDRAAVGCRLPPEGLDDIRRYLAEERWNEVLLIASAGGDELKTIWTDLDGTYENRFLETVREAEVPGGSICVLPITQIDSAEFWLVKAKRPNENGEVPLRGAY
jgi:hypothetical protein